MQELSSLLSPKKAKIALSRLFFRDFVSYTKPDYRFNWHHVLICNQLQRFASGEIKKLMVFMPPQHGKSQLTTRHFPAYLLGIKPSLKIGVCSYSATLAQSFNRDIQRIIDDNPYHDVFPETLLNQSNVTTDAHGAYLRNSDIFETLNFRGFVKTVGVGGSLTGTPIDVGIIDDPFKDREEAMSIRIRDKVWSWYTDVFKTRLHNDSQELLIMCMVGETPVLMEDGTETQLKNIQVGDRIATYDNGNLTSTKVLNWKKQGLDFVYEIRMSSGILVKANERHPFLVCKNGITEWKKLKNLKPGDEILRVMQGGGHTKASRVPTMDAINQPGARDIARHTIKKPDGLTGIGQNHPQQNQDERRASSGGTASAFRSIIQLLRSKMEDVRFVVNCLLQRIPGRIGMVSYALTTATKQARSEAYYATTATLPLATEALTKSLSRPRSTCDFTTDTIEEIVPIGKEYVYDIQVDRTENFIANGLVSHNTRWDTDDLAGRILKQEQDWEVIVFQAIKEREVIGDPRQIGEVLWPEKHSLERILSIKQTSPFTFTSLYQQEPKPSKESLVFPEWDEYEEEPDIEPLIGVDFGFSNDPTAIAQVKIHKGNMFVRELLYETGLTNTPLDHRMTFLGLKRRRIVADSQESKTIEEFKKERKYNIVPCIKGPGSVNAGINWIKDHKLFVHKSSHNLKNELFNYQFIMVSGVSTNDPIDSHNHLLDAIRYTKILHRQSTGLNIGFHR
jgi:hypothetical protein